MYVCSGMLPPPADSGDSKEPDSDAEITAAAAAAKPPAPVAAATTAATATHTEEREEEEVGYGRMIEEKKLEKTKNAAALMKDANE